MSTIHHTATRLDEFHTEQTGRSRPAGAHAFWFIAVKVLAFGAAAGDGFAAYRRYEHLKSWGVQDNTALRHAFLQ